MVIITHDFAVGKSQGMIRIVITVVLFAVTLYQKKNIASKQDRTSDLVFLC